MTSLTPIKDFSSGNGQPTEDLFQTELKLNFDLAEQDRKIGILKKFCLILILVQLSSIPSYLAEGWLLNQPGLLGGGLVCILSSLAYFFCRRMIQPKHYKWISWLIVLVLFLDTAYPYILLGNQIPVILASMFSIVLALMLLGPRAAIIISSCNILLALVLGLGQYPFNFYQPVIKLEAEFQIMISALCALILIPGLLGLLVVAFRSQSNLLQSQNQKLHDSLYQMAERQRTGQHVSQQVLTLAAELNAIAGQQATGSQEQVAAITQVTTSLEELSETAAQIAQSAGGATDSANHTLAIATEVGDTSRLAQSTAFEGTQAVEQTIGSVEQVRNRIELLGQRLLHLTEQTRQVGTIMDIIEEIADETQLLALNASIEAAGSPNVEGTGGRNQGRGERFAVIAQEVKNLAERSRESTEEVRQSITEMQGAVAAAVLVAEEGKKETSSALTRSRIAGAVIEKLNEVVTHSANHSLEILQAVEEVKTRSEEINAAAAQQRSASRQVLEALRSLSVIARQSADGSSLVSSTAINLEQVSSDLKLTLIA
jgi:methyl-accepting chemotaxis protein